MDWYQDQKWQAFAANVKNNLVPMIKNSDIYVAICPTPDKVDAKFAVELGVAVMLDKPMVAVVKPGTPISEKLSRVIDRFIECDISQPSERERLAGILKQMANDGFAKEE